MMRALVFVMAMAATPLLAQGATTEYDPAILQNCLEETPMLDRRNCIGQASSSCVEQPGMYTTIGMVMCMDSEVAQWDALLNESYGKLVDHEAAIDAELDAAKSSAPRLRPALRDMQRAWIAYRDATCNYEAAQFGGGTGAGPAGVGCMMQLTGEQALKLMQRVEDSADN